MAKVWFRCNGKNSTMFVLNSLKKDMDYVPLVGDIILTGNSDFQKTSFRIKPWYKDNDNKRLKDSTSLDFKVISRSYSLRFDEWELICEPQSESLVSLLKYIKT